MGEAVLLDRVLERARDVRLPDQVVERLGPVFARENRKRRKNGLHALSQMACLLIVPLARQRDGRAGLFSL